MNVLAGILIGHVAIGGDAQFSLPEIRAVVEKYTRGITTIEGRQEVVFDSGRFNRTTSPEIVAEDLTVNAVFKVDLIHRRTLLVQSQTWYFRDISLDPFSTEAEVNSFDGEKSYFLAKTLSHSPLQSRLPPNTPYRLMIGPKNQTTVHQSVWKLAGLPCAGPDVTLAAILSSTDTKISGERTIDGHKCANIKATIGVWRVEASLDPTVSWLPRRFTASLVSSSDSAPVFEQESDEFKEFPTGAGNEKIWFPVRGREMHMQSTIVAIHLIDVRFNAEIQKSEFQVSPESLPPGVEVTTPSGMNYTGGRKDLYDELDKLMNEESDAMQMMINDARKKRTGTHEPSEPIRVDPKPRTNLFATILGVLSLVILFMGIKLAWKHS